MYTRYIYIYIITSLTKIIYRCKITLRVFIVGANVLCTGYPPHFHHPYLRSRGTVGQFSVLAMFRVTDPLLISTPDPPPLHRSSSSSFFISHSRPQNKNQQLHHTYRRRPAETPTEVFERQYDFNLLSSVAPVNVRTIV